MERRKFIRYIGVLGTAFYCAPNLLSCSSKGNQIKLKTLGANKQRGHFIRDLQKLPNPTVTSEIKTLIIGGGISGLTAGYFLNKKGDNSYRILELNDKAGGNSLYKSNEISDFPLGAHYLTLPNAHNRTLIDFLKEHKLIVHETFDNKQEYAEDQLCHAPDERLLIRGVFQEGLVPSYGLPEVVQKEIQNFFTLMENYKKLKDEDGVFVFDIPLQFASKKSDISKNLDKITFKQFLDENNFDSEELLWFLDYCCRDDFGAGFDKVSAWAGVNYFAGRKSSPSNTIPSNVLTWNNGNGHLLDLIKNPIKDKIEENTIVLKVEELEECVIVTSYNFLAHSVEKIKCKKVIMATPSYVNKHIIESKFWNEKDFENYIHHPWLVTSVILSKIPEGNGLELSWDNVKYQTKGLGYIYNQHQEFSQIKEKIVISVYLAFDKQGDKIEREKMFSLSEEEMKALVLKELNDIHPGIEEFILEMNFQQWGHGMVTPYPGSFSKTLEIEKKNRTQSKIILAHTDFSGYSVFEEAFNFGYQATNFIE